MQLRLRQKPRVACFAYLDRPLVLLNIDIRLAYHNAEPVVIERCGPTVLLSIQLGRDAAVVSLGFPGYAEYTAVVRSCSNHSVPVLQNEAPIYS